MPRLALALLVMLLAVAVDVFVALSGGPLPLLCDPRVHDCGYVCALV